MTKYFPGEVLKILEETATETVNLIDKYCDFEAQSPSTMSTQLFDNLRGSFARYISELHQSSSGRTPRAPRQSPFPDLNTLQWQLGPVDDHRPATINQQRALMPTANNVVLTPVVAHEENFEVEIMVFSKVLAYSHISLGRFIDTASYTIGWQFLDKFCIELERKLAVELGIDGSKGEALYRRYATDRP